MDSIQLRVYKERYLRTAALFRHAVKNHAMMGVLFAAFLFFTTDLETELLIWYASMCVVIGLRHVSINAAVKKLDGLTKTSHLFDLLFAAPPILNGFIWSIGIWLALSQNNFQVTIASLLVAASVAFHGYSYLSYSRASYIGYFVAVFSLPTLYFFVEGFNLIGSVFVLGMLHFVFFNTHQSDIATLRLYEHFEHTQLIAKLKQAEKQLTEHAEFDNLTGLYRKREYEKRFIGLKYLSIIRQQPIGVALFDIDHFKQFNDTYGHLFGDEVLVKVANLINAHTSSAVFAGRFGGEEFVLIGRFDSRAQFVDILERIRKQTEQLLLSEHNSSVTISAGACFQLSTESTELREYILESDSALYQAKATGRNKVLMSDELANKEEYKEFSMS
ncbi:response regulator/GGDEF domain protein [Vibrio maritimus]|uniref:diguanylate cyclase n=1 Tax=Vibrio maritimus TaxID=990268 RepID=A0A090TCJ6_9VIBR|nr:response regulator/GGDEF domain protein [Vibrio maritimus]